MEPNESMMNHFDLSCKYCSFSCSGENIEMLCKHFEECRHILVTCSNEQCGYTTERHLMKDHSATCSSAIVNCPNIRCNDKINRMEMFSHMEKCLFRIVPCKNKFNGCNTSVAYMDLEKHLETCPFYFCAICNEYLMLVEQSAHICALETIKSPCLNKEESLRMPCKRHHELPTVNFKCKFCKYTDVCRSQVLLHMVNKCKYKQRKCLLCCDMVLSAEWDEHRLSNCNATVRCTECKLRVEKSSETEHPKECIGNIKRTTCLICKELVKTGDIKCRQDMDRQHKMHKDVTALKHSCKHDTDQKPVKVIVPTSRPNNQGECESNYDPERVLSNATEIDRNKVIKIRHPEQSNSRESLQKLRIFIKNIDKYINRRLNIVN